MRGTGDEEASENLGINASVRWIPEIPVERAELRTTATYRVWSGAYLGLEYNPLDDDLGILANWRIVDETEHRPTVMVGTSSDRIGTPSGRAYYLTLAKDLEQHTDLPVAPYVGTSYGEFDDEFVLVGGANIRWSDRFVSTHVWDGHNLHHMLDSFWEGGYRVGVIVAQQGSHYYAGLSAGIGL